MKRIPFIISIITLSFTLVACGENTSAATTPEKEEVETDNTTEYVNSDGEGEGQGVIKSDEELAALEAEATEYYSGEDDDTYVIESKEEVAKEETTECEKPWYGPLGTSDYKAQNYPYVPADGYWISENQFDLVGWIRANGGGIRFYSKDGPNQDEENEDTMMYRCSFLYAEGLWEITMGGCPGFDVVKDDETCATFVSNDTVFVDINPYGCCTNRDVIDAIDYVLKETKANPAGPFLAPSGNSEWIQ